MFLLPYSKPAVEYALPILGPSNVFLPVNSRKQNTNAKYSFGSDQFYSRNAPILTFFSYYDNRGEYPRDHMKFRNCNIVYYVEDGTIKVYEPNQINSGFRQGCLIGRNKIPKIDGGYYSLDDINIGKTVIFFGKTFKILNCDEFTKNYIREMGYRVGSPESAVIDPVYADRQQMDMNLPSVKQIPHSDNKCLKFFKFHPKCLHFYVIYNYKPRYYEEIHYASLYINIVDNTIKIVDEKKRLEYEKQLMIGNYDSYLLLNTTLIPKKSIGIQAIGNFRSPVILNLTAKTSSMNLKELSSSKSGGAIYQTGFMRDCNPSCKLDEMKNYYTVKDFDLGITIDVFGTKVFVYDCDEYTKEFYRNEFCKELIPVALPKIRESKYPQLVYKEHFGNPEDSLQTYQQLPSINASKHFLESYLLPQAPCCKGLRSGVLLKFFLQSRNGNDSKVLKFVSKIVTNDVLLKNQYFVIQWFLEDGTIQINGLDLNFATSDSNCPVFLKRIMLAKPTSQDLNAATCYYTPADMYVGNIIYAVKKPFLILEADEYTYDYMERHCDIFTNSNIKDIFKSFLPAFRRHIYEISNCFKTVDLDNIGFVSYYDFRSILLNYIPKNMKTEMTEHKVKTLARYFASKEYNGLNYSQLVAEIHIKLKKRRFEDFDKLETLFHIFQMEDKLPNGHFEPERTYKILRSYPLPIDRDILKAFVLKFPKCEGLIPYKSLVAELNYFDNPVKPPDQNPYAININWEQIEVVRNVNRICYNLFLKLLNGENCPNCK